MTGRRPELDTRWASSLELKTFWSGFWLFFRRAPTGLGTALFRGFAIVLVPVPLLFSLFFLGAAIKSDGPGPAAPRVLLALVFGTLVSILGTWGMAKFSLVPAFFTLIGKAIEGPTPEEEDRGQELSEPRARRLAELAAEKAREARAGGADTASDPRPQAWTRPEPPPGAVLGPRRLEDGRRPSRPRTQA